MSRLKLVPFILTGLLLFLVGWQQAAQGQIIFRERESGDNGYQLPIVPEFSEWAQIRNRNNINQEHSTIFDDKPEDDIGQQSSSGGEWVKHSFLYPSIGTVYSACGADCLSVSPEDTTSMLFFDITESAWVELEFDSQQTIRALQAQGHTVLAYTDELLIGYSALTSEYKTTEYIGTVLSPGYTNQSYGVGENLAFFVTEERMYVFDAELGQWQEYDYGLPDDYSFSSYAVKDDYVVATFHRAPGERPKYAVYSLHTHGFNKLDYGCYGQPDTLDHGFACVYQYEGSDEAYQLIGYSTYDNAFDQLEVSNQGDLRPGNRASNPDILKATTFAVTFRQVIEPYVSVRADLYGYDTRLGNWSHITMDFDWEDERYYSNWLHGGQFAIDHSIYNDTEAMRFIFYSGLTGQFDTISPGIEWESTTTLFREGGTVYAAVSDEKAWGYDMINESGSAIVVDKDASSNAHVAEDYFSVSRYSNDSNRMTTYVYNSNTNNWTTIELPKEYSASSYSLEPHLFVFSPYDPDQVRETIFYSSLLDSYIKRDFPAGTYVGPKANGVLAYARSSHKSYLFDAQSGAIHEFDFQFGQNGLGHSAATFCDLNTNTLYGYSSLSEQWTTLTIVDSPYTCSNIGFIGLVTNNTGTQYYTEYYAYNSLKDSWVTLIPTGGYKGSCLGEKTALVKRSNALYAFDPDGGPAIQYTLTVTSTGSGNVTLSPPGGRYAEGTEVLLTATANSGWMFSSWSGNLIGSTNPISITMDSNKSITATFIADTDDDGVSDVEENAGPNGGDGNNDDTPDNQQSNVTSLLTYDKQHYVTISSPTGTSLNHVQALDNPSSSSLPQELDFSYGLFEFTITGIQVGTVTSATFFLPAGEITPTTYYKYGPTPETPTDHWYEFLFDGETGAEINGNVITLHFVDGLRGDNDLLANGIIVEPGAPAWESAETPDIYLPVIFKNSGD